MKKKKEENEDFTRNKIISGLLLMIFIATFVGVMSLLYWSIEKEDCTYEIQDIVFSGAFYESVSWNVDNDKIEYLCTEKVAVSDYSNIGTIWFKTQFIIEDYIKHDDGTCVIKVHRQKCEPYTGWRG